MKIIDMRTSRGGTDNEGQVKKQQAEMREKENLQGERKQRKKRTEKNPQKKKTCGEKLAD